MTRARKRQPVWSDDECMILIAHYRENGSRWEGWESLLPGRSQGSIERKAYSMGLRVEKRRKPVRKKPQAKPDPYERRHPAKRTQDPYEGMIMRMLKDGMTPSQIDRHMHWPPDRTKLILTEKWDRERK